MSVKRIVITGGPSTGKTALINHLKELGYCCLEEISRQITLAARNQGIEQLFLTQPLLFSKRLLEGRVLQYKTATKLNKELVFYDRGLPDVLAYINYIGEACPNNFTKQTQSHPYNLVFICKPWEAIYKQDSERYETFEQALDIHDNLLQTYKSFNYSPINVPFGTITQRSHFILEQTKILC